MNITEDERMDDDTCDVCEGDRTLMCNVCSGSGEGPADGTTCRACHGGGEVPCDGCGAEEDFDELRLAPRDLDQDEAADDYDRAADAYQRDVLDLDHSRE